MYIIEAINQEDAIRIAVERGAYRFRAIYEDFNNLTNEHQLMMRVYY